MYLMDWLCDYERRCLHGGWDVFVPVGARRRVSGRRPGLGWGIDLTFLAKDGEIMVLAGPLGPPGRRFPGGFRASGEGSGAVASHPSRRDVETAFDEALRDLVDTLDKIAQAHRPSRSSVVFQGGEGLVLPKWFFDEMKRRGIDIVVLDPESGEAKSVLLT